MFPLTSPHCVRSYTLVSCPSFSLLTFFLSLPPPPLFLVLLSQLQSSFISFPCFPGLLLTSLLPLPPSLCLLGVSLLAQFTQPTHFMGLIPFLTVCLQVWGQVLICLSLFFPSLASSLTCFSFALCS